ncbi:MAG: penicillinase repressor [Planctomyces sp.]|nr:penicillinase repressor [Planctomyces sp.]
MARPEAEHPTELELEILKILWSESPLPVREVRLQLERDAARPLAHSSVITILNIMYRKGFVTRERDGKSFLFSPRIPRESVAGEMMQDLLSRVFSGSAAQMMLNLLETSDLDEEELVAMRKMINRKVKEHRQ